MNDVAETVDQTVADFGEKKATQLPKPQGYHILCAIPEIEEKFDSGLLKASETQKMRKFWQLCYL